MAVVVCSAVTSRHFALWGFSQFLFVRTARIELVGPEHVKLYIFCFCGKSRPKPPFYINFLTLDTQTQPLFLVPKAILQCFFIVFGYVRIIDVTENSWFELALVST